MNDELFTSRIKEDDEHVDEFAPLLRHRVARRCARGRLGAAYAAARERAARQSRLGARREATRHVVIFWGDAG